MLKHFIALLIFSTTSIVNAGGAKVTSCQIKDSLTITVNFEEKDYLVSNPVLEHSIGMRMNLKLKDSENPDAKPIAVRTNPGDCSPDDSNFGATTNSGSCELTEDVTLLFSYDYTVSPHKCEITGKK